MAVVVRAEDTDKFIAYAGEENLEAVAVAEVSDSGSVRMYWRKVYPRSEKIIPRYKWRKTEDRGCHHRGKR